jgi:hypothetical protein
MRCNKCGQWVYQETILPTEEDENEYVAYLHYNQESSCFCEGIEEVGTYDGTKSPVPLTKKEKSLHFFTIDQAMKIYFEDGLLPGQTWKDVREHDRGGQTCNCSACVVQCKICKKRKIVLEK